MDDDHMLLSRFAKSKDERAFTELVRRHLDMVYGVCLRRTGNRQLAEEMVQNVFATLARKAGSLRPEVLVLGWLHRTAHFQSLSAFRSEVSRLRTMKNYTDFQSQTDAEPDRFREISPFLDEALHALPPSDRDVILLRFASDLTLQQIGHRLGKSESAAQRHLQRVLDKLAVILRRRGVTTSATALALMLGVDFAKAAPASLTVAFVSKTAIASGTAASGMTLVKITTLLYIMKNKAIIIASVCLLTAGGSAIYLTAQPSSAVVKSPLSSAKVAGNSAPGSVRSNSKDLVTAMSGDPAKNSTDQRLRPVSEYHELEEKFGASRVRLSKSATASWLKLSDALLQIAEFKISPESEKDDVTSFSITGMEDPLESVTGLTLSDEQKAKMKIIKAKQDAKAVDAFRTMLTSFSKNRTKIMEMMLASDAIKRGQMTTGEFQAILDHNDKLVFTLKNIMPLKNTIQNPLYRTELPSILDADQMAVFEKFRSEQEVKEPAVEDVKGFLGIRWTSDGPNLDAKTLEQIDEAFRKAAAQTDGMLKVMEATRGN